MKIFQIVDSRKFGGIETHILQLSLYLKSQNIDNTVIFTSYYCDNALRDLLIKNEIKYEENTLLLNIKNYSDAIFHSHGYKANIFNKFYKLKFKQKTICSYHSGEKHKGKVFFYELLDKKTAFISERNIAISEKIKNQILTKNKKVIYNFINQDANYCDNEYINNISFVGRLSKEKQPQDFLSISREHKCLNFNIFGEGELEHLIEKQNNLHYYGYVDKQDKIWKNTDVLLITSKYEGLPYVLIEAMAHGLIVVSYDVGEVSNIIKNGKNGFIAKNKDEMNLIIENLQYMDKSKNKLIKKSALQTFENLFGKKAGQNFLNYYN